MDSGHRFAGAGALLHELLLARFKAVLKELNAEGEVKDVALMLELIGCALDGLRLPGIEFVDGELELCYLGSRLGP